MSGINQLLPANSSWRYNACHTQSAETTFTYAAAIAKSNCEDKLVQRIMAISVIVLADFYNEESGKAWPSQDTLCMLTGLSRATFNRALKELKDKGHITIWKERTSGQYPHSAYRINHVSERDIVEEVDLKSEQTMYQKGALPCRTVRHYPLTTLKNTLDHGSNKKERIVGLPQTPDEFQKLPSAVQENYYYWKPNVQKMLEKAGFNSLKEASKQWN